MKNILRLTFGIALLSVLMMSCEKSYNCECTTNIKVDDDSTYTSTSVVAAYSMLTKKEAQKNCDGTSQQYIDDFKANMGSDTTNSSMECVLNVKN